MPGMFFGFAGLYFAGFRFLAFHAAGAGFRALLNAITRVLTGYGFFVPMPLNAGAFVAFHGVIRLGRLTLIARGACAANAFCLA
jgi:hypothetical protein